MKYINHKDNEKVRVAFLFQVASFWPSWGSLFNYLLKDDRFESRMYLLEDHKIKQTQMRSARDFLETNEIEYIEFTFEKIMSFRPHYLIMQTPYDRWHRSPQNWAVNFKRHGIRVVYIPYGIEISDNEESRIMHFNLSVVRNARLIYVMSKQIAEEYRMFCSNYSAVRAEGLPRFDSLYDHVFTTKNDVRERSCGRKIILWKAHFPKYFEENGVQKQATPKIEEYLKYAEYLKDNKNVFCIFMPHPKFCDVNGDGHLKPYAVKLVNYLEKLDNVFIDWNDDYRYSLYIADAVMIDRSAVMVEAASLEKPIMYLYNTDYYEPMPAAIESLVNTYHKGSACSDMISFTEGVIDGTIKSNALVKAKFDEVVPCFDGRVSERIAQNLLEELKTKNDFHQLDRIYLNTRIIIFGAAKTWKNIKSFCGEFLTDRFFDIVAVIDNDKSKQGDYYEGVMTWSADNIADFDYDYIVLATENYVDAIKNQLITQFNVNPDKILAPDEFLVLYQEEVKRLNYEP